jgi:hypothetical protein
MTTWRLGNNTTNKANAQKNSDNLTTLLLGHTNGPAAATSRLGVLAADAEAPVVTETTVGTDLLQALQVLTELGVDTVGKDLRGLAIDNVALTVEEPLLTRQHPVPT